MAVLMPGEVCSYREEMQESEMSWIKVSLSQTHATRDPDEPVMTTFSHPLLQKQAHSVFVMHTNTYKCI